MSLVELLVAMAVIAMIAGASVTLIGSGLQSRREGLAQARLHDDAILLMDRLTDAVRRATWVTVPNAHARTRDMLVVSGFTNDDDDYYFGDTLFPRIDEDPPDDMNGDKESGNKNIDEDGDGQPDEEGENDDDEDDDDNEDPLDGLDDDDDGNIDEDVGNDLNDDGKPGVRDMDDDGDGLVDEGSHDDDDEDGFSNEDPLNERMFWLSAPTTLTEEEEGIGLKHVLSHQVAYFEVTCISAQLFRVGLTLTNTSGQSVSMTENACARSVLQSAGKRVR